jgi:hypothetical protein
LGSPFSIDQIQVLSRPGFESRLTNTVVLFSNLPMNGNIDLATLQGTEGVTSTQMLSVPSTGLFLTPLSTKASAQPILTGMGEAGATVEITDTVTNSVLGTAKVNSSGGWTFQATGITSGTHSIAARQTDVAGNVSNVSSAFTFTVDPTLLSAPALLDDSDTGVKGDGITSEVRPGFVGQVSAIPSDGSVKLFGGANSDIELPGTVTTQIQNGVTTWSFVYNPSGTVLSGENNIVAKVLNSSNNPVATSAPLRLTIDNAPPAVPTVVLGTGVSNEVNGTNRAEALQGTGVVTVNAESGSTVTVTFTRAANTVTKTLTGTGAAQAVILNASDLSQLGDGTVSVIAVVKDAADNSSTTTPISFTLDATVPLAPRDITLAPRGGTVVSNALNSSNTALDLSATITQGQANGGRAEFYVNGTLVGKDESIEAGDTSVNFTATGTDLASLTAGGQVNVLLFDAAGNRVSGTADNPLVIDRSAPTLSASSPPSTALTNGGDGLNDTITLTVTFDGPVYGLTTDSSTSSTSIFTVGGVGVNAVWGGADGSNTRTLTYTVATGQEGQAAINESALKAALVAGIQDAAGNAFSFTGLINNIDSTPLPVVSTSNPQWQASSLSGVTNLDVTSNLVFKSDKALKVGTGSIRILDLNAENNRTGFRNDTNDNDQFIDVVTAVDNGLIEFRDNDKTIIINPKWDLDLSSSYRIEWSEGAFVSDTGGLLAPAFSASFGTVTPGNVNTTDGGFSSDAQRSQIMKTDGTLADSKKWFDYGQIGKNGTLTFGGDLSGDDYALVVKNYATRVACPPIYENNDINGDVIQEAYGGINTPPFKVSFDNFGLNDMFYFDSQKNNEQEQKVDQRWVPVYHNPGQFGRRLVMDFGKGADTEFENDVAAAFVAFSLEGETNAAVYNSFNAIESWQDPIFGSRTGFSGTQYASSSAVIMG